MVQRQNNVSQNTIRKGQNVLLIATKKVAEQIFAKDMQIISKVEQTKKEK